MRSAKLDFLRKSDSAANTRSVTQFERKVYDAVKKIPKGKVAAYQEIAAAIGHPRASRAVGNALSKNSFRDVPCHRVVRSDGSTGGFARGKKEKIKLLRKEGVFPA